MSSIREISRRTGYSVATVSRVFNQPDSVTRKTRELIEEVASELGYQPNPAARALATRRTRIIGAAIPGIEHSIFARFIAALEQGLKKQGYALVLATTNFDPELEFERCKDLIRLGAEGIIVSGLEHRPELLNLCRQRRVPLLCTSIHAADWPDLPTIGYDNYELAVDAANFLTKLGHELVAVIHGPLHNNDRTRYRIEGIRSVLPDAMLVESDLSVQGGCEGLKTLETLGASFTAILCLSDVIAQGVYFEAQRRGYRIPETLSIMGFDDLDWAEWMSPPLTTIHLPADEMGHESALALIRHLDHHEPISSLRLQGHIVVRDSTSEVGRTRDPRPVPGEFNAP